MNEYANNRYDWPCLYWFFEIYIVITFVYVDIKQKQNKNMQHSRWNYSVRSLTRYSAYMYIRVKNYLFKSFSRIGCFIYLYFREHLRPRNKNKLTPNSSLRSLPSTRYWCSILNSWTHALSRSFNLQSRLTTSPPLS